MITEPEQSAESVRSDRRPHAAKDRCIFGCEEADWLWAALRDTYGDLQQLVPGFSKPYVEAKLAAQSDGLEGAGS